jgi:hypothetical protein
LSTLAAVDEALWTFGSNAATVILFGLAVGALIWLWRRLREP